MHRKDKPSGRDDSEDRGRRIPGRDARGGPRPANAAGPRSDRDADAFDAVPAHAPEILVLDRESARKLDAHCEGTLGIPTLLLMENAAIAVAAGAMEICAAVEDPAILIVCGRGNNGGDGLAAARQLRIAGARIAIILAPESRSTAEAAAANLEICRRLGIPIFEVPADGETVGDAAATFRRAITDIGRPCVLIDALLGTGTHGQIEGVAAAMIEEMNRLADADDGLSILAVDIPSGLDADTGAPLARAKKADDPTAVFAAVTVTLAAIKPGMLTLEAQPYIGEVQVGHIGVPEEVVRRFATVLALEREDPETRGGDDQ